MSLPTFEEMCRNASRCLADARDWMNSDWRPGTVLADEQAAARVEAMRHIAKAKAALDRAAR